MSAGQERATEAGNGGTLLEGLSFLDLIYAVPVGDLAMRVSSSNLGDVTVAQWLDLGVCMTTIVLSWVGLHKNRRDMLGAGRTRELISDSDFLSLRFLQFLFEVLIIVLYFFMGLDLHLPMGGHLTSPNPPTVWVAGTVLAVFVAYAAWDVLDILQAHRVAPPAGTEWRTTATAGFWVTLPFAAIFGVCYLCTMHDVGRSWSRFLWPLVLMALLYMYRVLQENRCNRALRTLAPAPATPQQERAPT